MGGFSDCRGSRSRSLSVHRQEWILWVVRSPRNPRNQANMEWKEPLQRDVSRKLGGGFKDFFLFSPLFREDFQFDEHIFQMGWNHQPEKNKPSIPFWTTGTDPLDTPKLHIWKDFRIINTRGAFRIAVRGVFQGYVGFFSKNLYTTATWEFFFCVFLKVAISILFGIFIPLFKGNMNPFWLAQSFLLFD